MKVYIVVILVLATLTCSALAKSSSKKASASKEKSCKKSDKSCKACFDACYKWSDTNTTNLLTSSVIHFAIKSFIHKEDTDRKIPATPSKECTGSGTGSPCTDKCKVAKVSYRSTGLKVGSTLEIHSCGKCDANEKDIPWEKTSTAHEALSKITGAEMKVEFKCSGYSVRASLMVLLLGVLLTLKAAF